jgi:hypothetical protein
MRQLVTEIEKEDSRLQVLLWVLLGLGLCSSIPIVPLGPSFIVWPSTSEIAGSAFFILALYGFSRTGKGRLPGMGRVIGPIYIISILYICLTTLLFAGGNQFAVVYSVWSLLRILQWAVIIPYILFTCKPRHLQLLIIGIIIGGVINAIVSISQRFDFLTPRDLFAHLNTLGGGPYAVIAKKGLVKGESIGIFSYTRIATGFFLSLSFFAAMIFFKRSFLIVPMLILFALGIVFTGSRLGFSVFVFMTMALFLHRKYVRGLFFGFCILCLVVIIYANVIESDFVIGRLVGISDTYGEGIQSRMDRQMVVFGLPIGATLWGCGLGNLGSALGLTHLRFYRSHGWFFTYLGEIGVFGTFLLSCSIFAIIKKLGALNSYFGIVILCVIVFSGFVDDFMIPSAQSAHLPLITAIVLRFAVTTGGYRIVWNRDREMIADSAIGNVPQTTI